MLRPRSLLSLFALVALAACARPGHTAGIAWPGTEIAGHARAWFAMLAGDDAAARAFFAAHMAPAAMAEAGLDVRLERRRATLERTQGLEPLEIVSDDPAAIGVRCRAGNGDDVTAWFTGEPSPPHRLLGVRLEAGPGGPGGPGGGPPHAGPPLSDAEAVRTLRSHLDAHAAAGDFSGVALLARGDSVLTVGAWGLADRARGVAVTPGTRFNLASIGKVLTRAAIAQLAERGQLSLADPLAKWLPEWPHADSITIGMLCAHRSGVGDFFGPAYDAMDHARLRHNRDYLGLLRDQPLWFAPGTAQRYSNGGYVLLGEVIAKAAGEDYYDYLAKHVFGPAGMTATAALVEGDGTKGVARGYTTEGAAQGERDNVATRPARGSAAGGSYSTLADLLALDRALLGARLCGKPWASWVTGGPRPMAGAAPAPAEVPSFGLAGGAPGVNAEWLHEGDVVMIVLTNRDPETARPTVEGVQDIVRRMKPGENRPPN